MSHFGRVSGSADGPNLEDAPDGVDVLRGGRLSAPSREKNLRDVHDAYGVWGICVKAHPGKTHAELAQSGVVRNREYMYAPTQELTAAGFRVVREPNMDWPDALLLFQSDDEPDGNAWDDLAVVLGVRPPLPNPTYRTS